MLRMQVRLSISKLESESVRHHQIPRIEYLKIDQMGANDIGFQQIEVPVNNFGEKQSRRTNKFNKLRGKLIAKIMRIEITRLFQPYGK